MARLHPSFFAGPLFAVSMFGPESLLGRLVRLAHNKRYPEATALNAASDWLAVQQACTSPGIVGALAEDLRPDVLESTASGRHRHAWPTMASLRRRRAAAHTARRSVVAALCTPLPTVRL
eukprot:357821-Chlamydomonas_euryale.AAC.2